MSVVLLFAMPGGVNDNLRTTCMLVATVMCATITVPCKTLVTVHARDSRRHNGVKVFHTTFKCVTKVMVTVLLVPVAGVLNKARDT